MTASRLDAVYRSILITKFFTKGWGKPENLRRLFEFRKTVSNRDECFKLIERDYPVTITKDETLSDCRLLEGYFMSPLERFLPGIVPEVAQKAHFQAILPLKWPTPGCKPVCLHLAGTGDHFFWRRRNLMVKPLLKEAGIGGIILENPFYGLRKPTDQTRSSLHNVSDIFVMGGCLILESLVLFHWCERLGLGPLGVTGLSMGGHMASLAATNWPKPLVLVPCLSWSTASAVFLQGVMAHSINWDLLEDQYLSDGVYREKLSKMVTVVDEAFLAGRKFAQTFSTSVAKNPAKKNVDVTYTETADDAPKAAEGSESDTAKLNAERAQRADKQSDELDALQRELKRLLDEGKLCAELYDKLTSGEMFELAAREIDAINEIHDDGLRQLVLRRSSATAKLKTEGKIETTDTAESIPKVYAAAIKDNTKAGGDVAILADDKIAPKEKKARTVSEITSDLWTNLPFVSVKSERKIDISKVHWRDREALQFMRGIMDECTHLSNFSVPFDTSLIIAVCATHDAYVPREDVGALEEIWPGADVRYVRAGHVSAYLLHQSLFRSCIIEAFERSKRRWRDGAHVTV